MEFLSPDPELGHFFIRDFNVLLVYVLVEYGVNRQPLGRSRVSNQVDDRVQADKRPTTPVLSNVAEHTVLDFVPFAGSRGEVTHSNGQPRFIRQPLQFTFPQSGPIPVATAGVSGNQQLN
jgi:hypothetical protein